MSNLQDNLPIHDTPMCVKAATKILGDKWTPRLLTELANNSPLRFTELQKRLAMINPRTLSARLQYLEKEQIVTRTTHARIPPCVEYSLTPKGCALLPILQAMAKWGTQYYTSSK